jgi:sialate O-acetylesterase
MVTKLNKSAFCEIAFKNQPSSSIPLRGFFSSVLLLLIFLSGLSTGMATPSLSGLWSDHMVLQRERKLPISGHAAAGEKIAIRIGGTQVETTANPDGRWETLIGPLSAGGPMELVIQGETSIIFHDVLIGEVWLCSGQSNMQFELGRDERSASLLLKANYPGIRLFKVPHETSLQPIQGVQASWQICTSETARTFSAVAFFFGENLHRELGVPIGLIESSWGGTSAEEWTNYASLEKDPDFLPILRRWQETPGSIKEIFVSPPEIDLWLDDLELFPKDPQAQPLRVDDFEAKSNINLLGGAWKDQWVNPKEKFQVRRESNDSNTAGKALHITGPLKVGNLLNLEVNYLPDQIPKDLSAYRSVSFRVKGKGYLKVHSIQPTILDWDNYASEIIPATEQWKKIEIPFSVLRQAGWGVVQPITLETLTALLFVIFPAPVVPPHPPGGLFNGMISPLIPYAIRGAAWYQGEGNAGRAAQYRKLLPALIESWRSAWKAGDWPFLVVQLPNFRPSQIEPAESEWAELREAQSMALTLPATGLVVSIDQGESNNVHPKRKSEIGRRLALCALGTVYEKPLVYSGPVFDSMKPERSQLRLYFKQTGSGLSTNTDKPLTGFALAGADRKFYWAKARIEGNTVVVWNEQIPNPVAVRYAWADNPEANLYNREGLPASPFRTDRWPGITEDKK